MTHETKEVRCRCGEQIYTAPSSSVRCPKCGRRLFWKCQCGALVERTISRCPYCHTIRERSRAEIRPPLRLRKILGAGLVGAFVFSLIGYWLIKAFSRLLPTQLSSSVLSLPQQGGNIVVQILKGVLLLFADLIGALGQIVYKNPALIIFAIVGFLIAATLAARHQRFSLRRLKRHLRRKWEEFISRRL